ncbi:hypothetical protein P9112_011468 [Eukaryota sp. TZLM1-RC]
MDPSSINDSFPSFTSLEHLSTAIGDGESRVSQLEQKLRESVRDNSTFVDKGSQSLTTAFNSFNLLKNRLEQLQSRLSVKELSIASTFGDVATFDMAKQNISSTLTVLRQVALLLSSLNALGKLQADDYPLVESKSHVAVVLEIAKQLRPLANTVSLPNGQLLSSLLESVELHSENILSRCFSIPSNIDYNNPNDDDMSCLSAATACVDAMANHSIRSSFTHVLCNSLLNCIVSFDSSFIDTLTSGALDNHAQSLRFLFSQYLQIRHCIPNSWNIPYILGMEFVDQTRQILLRSLDVITSNSQYSVDGAVILALHRRTQKLENEVFKIVNEISSGDFIMEDFANEDEDHMTSDILRRVADNVVVSSSAGMTIDNPSNLAAIKRKYKQMFANNKETESVTNPFLNMMTCAFDTHLAVYVVDEQAKLRNIIEKVFDLSILEMSTDTFAFPSSFALFKEIKAILHRSTKLSQGQLLFDVYRMLKKELIKYSDSLTECIISGEKLKANSLEEQSVLRVIGSCNFCSSTIDSLAFSLSDLILEAYKPEINFDDVVDAFTTTTQRAAQSFTDSILTYLNSSSMLMVRQQWSSMRRVGDVSSWVTSAQEVLEERIPILKQISECRMAVHYVLDAVVSNFYGQLYTNITTKIDSFNNFGTQQMLFDLSCLKTTFQKLPDLTGTVASRAFGKLLRRNHDKIELLLKVLLSPTKLIVRNYLSLIGTTSTEDFTRFLELRGIKGKETHTFMEEYLMNIGR